MPENEICGFVDESVAVVAGFLLAAVAYIHLYSTRQRW